MPMTMNFTKLYDNPFDIKILINKKIKKAVSVCP